MQGCRFTSPDVFLFVSARCLCYALFALGILRADFTEADMGIKLPAPTLPITPVRVVVGGPPGSGKSSVASGLARQHLLTQITPEDVVSNALAVFREVGGR